MLDHIKTRFALSTKGAHDFVKAVFLTTLLNMALMLPAVFVFLFLDDYLRALLAPTDKPHGTIWYYMAIGTLFMLITWLLGRFQHRSAYTSIYEESANRRISLAEKLRTLPLAFFGEKNLSDLTSTIMTDNTELEHTFSHAVPQLFASLISLSLIAAALFIHNWQLSLALFWVAPVAAAVLLASKQQRKRSNKTTYDAQRDVMERIQEGLETIQEIKSYGNEARYLADLDQTLDTYEKVMTRGELLGGVLLNSAQSLLKLGIASVIIVGAQLLAAGTVDLFTFFIFLIVASRIYDPIGDVFNNLAALFYLDIRIDRMNEMASLPTQKGKTEYNPPHFDIVFHEVDFSYESGKQVLKNVSFTAKQGEITALVGPSGGGKSTSAKLAVRFWDADAGVITLGGRDVSTIDPETLLQNFSVVFQDVALFNTTIMENIRIGKRTATDKEVMRVARLAQCDEFIRSMPEGYQTVVGENGERLSGGERQRISIARALLKDAPVVLLDEATASLDVGNESKVQAGISELIRDKTVLIIAHRMRTVANADKIVVLENGTITESGKPDILRAKQDSVFAAMVDRQIAAANESPA